MARENKTAFATAKVFEIIGKAFVIISFFAGLIVGTQVIKSTLAGFLLGAFFASFSFPMVIMAQMTLAALDTENNTREMVEELKLLRKSLTAQPRPSAPSKISSTTSHSFGPDQSGRYDIQT